MDEAIEASLHSAAAESESRKEDLELLRTHTEQFGYRIVRNVPYNGDCFFHAVCVTLARPEFDATDLRHQLVTFLKKKV